MKLLPDLSNLAAVLESSRLYALGQGGSPADLYGANLRDADLRDTDLRGARLCDADLSGADLRDADLSWADLRGANLSRAYLAGTYLHGANLRGADLRWADLRDANLFGVNLRHADLSGAKFNWQSHALLGEVLRQEAGENITRRQIAGLVVVSTDLCWPDFLKLRLKEKRWALTTLAKRIQPGDYHPKILDKYKEEI